MKLQANDEKTRKITYAFDKLKAEHPERLKRRIDISFSSQCFGLEDVETSVERLAGLGYNYIEIPGNYGGCYSGNQVNADSILAAMKKYGVACSGICPSVPASMGLTATDYICRQHAAEHLIGNIKMARTFGGSYLLLTPGPVGVSQYVPGDYERSVSMVRQCAHVFTEQNIKCAIEFAFRGCMPFCENIDDTEKYIKDIDHPAVKWIYGDTEHMLRGEPHVGEAICRCGERLLCLHLRDTKNGLPIGNGSLDVDTIIRALYLIGFNTEGHYVVGEPDPSGYVTGEITDIFMPIKEEYKVRIAKETFDCFREREEELLKDL